MSGSQISGEWGCRCVFYKVVEGYCVGEEELQDWGQCSVFPSEIHNFKASIGDDIFEGTFGPSGKQGGKSISAVFGCLICEFVAKVSFMSRYIGEGYSEGKFFDHRVDSSDGNVLGFPWVAQVEQSGLIVKVKMYGLKGGVSMYFPDDF